MVSTDFTSLVHHVKNLKKKKRGTVYYFYSPTITFVFPSIILEISESAFVPQIGVYYRLIVQDSF